MKPLSLLQSTLGGSIPILCYHQVRPDSGMTPEKFGSHLDLLAGMGFKSISLKHLLEIIQGNRRMVGPSVVLTFDDCTLDNWVYAVPELLRRGMCAAFFAVTDFLAPGKARPRADQGGQGTPVPSLGEIMRRALKGHFEGFMNHDEVRAMVLEAGMEVYSHSAAHQACFINRVRQGVLGDNLHWSHEALCGPAPADTQVHRVGSAYAHAGFGLDWAGRPLTLTTPEERLAFCLDDFSRSKAHLESVLEKPCPFLCLPWGEYDDITLEAARQAGYEGVLNLRAGYVGPGTDPLRIGRLAVKDRKSRSWLGAKATLLSTRATASLVRGRRPEGRA
ncbi:polysaccharide deacetylase family protein [Desulfomicrobium salsuginis]